MLKLSWLTEKKPKRIIKGDELIMTKYQIGKEKARQKAVDWQLDFNNHNYSWGDLYEYQNYFSKLARRYGLVREFQENGII